MISGTVSTGKSNVPALPWIFLVSTAIGISGAEADGVTLAAADALPLPTELVAMTEQTNVELFVRPVTVMGDAVPVALNAPQLAV